MDIEKQFKTWHNNYENAFIVAIILAGLDGIFIIINRISKILSSTDVSSSAQGFGGLIVDIAVIILMWFIVFGIGVLITKLCRKIK